MQLDSDFYGLGGFGADATLQMGPAYQAQIAAVPPGSTWSDVLKAAVAGSASGALTGAQLALANMAGAKVANGQGNQIVQPTDWSKILLITGGVILVGVLLFKMSKKR